MQDTQDIPDTQVNSTSVVINNGKMAVEVTSDGSGKKSFVSEYPIDKYEESVAYFVNGEQVDITHPSNRLDTLLIEHLEKPLWCSCWATRIGVHKPECCATLINYPTLRVNHIVVKDHSNFGLLIE